MKKAILILALILGGCAVAFNPSKDIELMKMELRAHTLCDSIYNAIRTSPDRSIVAFFSSYAKEYSIMDSVITIQQTRPHGGMLLTISEDIKNTFGEFVAEHENLGVLNNVQAEIDSTYMERLFKSQYIAENSLK